MNENFFSDFDFSLLDSPDFKEDSVREELILPILKNLGYLAQGNNKIHRSKNVSHPFVQTGSGKHQLTSIPDYLLEVNGKYAWVLDAKAPNENIKTGKNVEQAYFYAIHPDIRVNFYVLCNGKEFILFHISQTKAVLYFSLSEIEKHSNELEKYLSPNAFQDTQIKIEGTKTEEKFDYLACKLVDEIKVVRKRAAKRHFGVHGYFTKQSWDVVQKHITNLTKPNDLVLDPFGGSGITLVEALMVGRKGIHIDLNPLSTFLVKSLIMPTNISELIESFEKIKSEYENNYPQTEQQFEEALKKYPFPSGNVLPRDSDVRTVEQLFDKRQLSQLAYLKFLIKKVKNESIRNSLLLAFSTTITKINLTYHHSTYASENAGDCSAFRYYRYRIAPSAVSLDTFKTFEGKFKNIVNAKKEIERHITKEAFSNAQIVKGTATNLNFIETESVDYIYTDPPYGKKIQYLDLSVMWNAWLDLEVSEEDYQLEAIEGGAHNKTKEDYSNLIAESIREMYRVLKFDRWMSFVFQHQDPAYWHLIKDTAEKIGFEYAGTVAQNNGQTSFKKRQNPFTVLSGQLIINFKKVNNPQTQMKSDLGSDVTDLIHQAIEDIIAHKHGASIDEINNNLYIKFIELNILHLVAKKYNDITPFLSANFDYDKDTQKYNLKKNTKFKAKIPVEARIKYYLISLMRQLAREARYPSFNEITYEIMPLLQNGKTPQKQTILSVLEEIADRVGGDKWKLKEQGQGHLFDIV